MRPVEKYYASEIDTYAMKVSQKNYPQIIQLGDIEDINRETIKELGHIDLIIGGSPCQGLSSSNVWLKDGEYGVNGTGKSRLFWQYVRILNLVREINPNVKFLLENVEIWNEDLWKEYEAMADESFEDIAESLTEYL